MQFSIRLENIHQIMRFGDLADQYQVCLRLSDGRHQIDTSRLEEIFLLDLTGPLLLDVDPDSGDAEAFQKELQKYPGTVPLR